LTLSEVADNHKLQYFNPLKISLPMSANLTKRDIVLSIYESTGIPQKDVRDVVQQTLDVIAQALEEGRNVELRNFGVFEVQKRKARIGRNPNKPDKDVVIPTRAVIKFKAGKDLKAKLKDLDLENL
jgi:integration host factor subunit beta